MDNIKKLIIVGYCLAVLFSVLFVPWKVVRQTENGVLANLNLGYSFIFSPPIKSVCVIDYGFVTLELIAITATAAICYAMHDKLSKITSALKQMRGALEKKGWTFGKE
ncbi:MAG: hypothetical protein WC560_08170 [Syntrophales bacterium]